MRVDGSAYRPVQAVNKRIVRKLLRTDQRIEKGFDPLRIFLPHQHMSRLQSEDTPKEGFRRNAVLK